MIVIHIHVIYEYKSVSHKSYVFSKAQSPALSCGGRHWCTVSRAFEAHMDDKPVGEILKM